MEGVHVLDPELHCQPGWLEEACEGQTEPPMVRRLIPLTFCKHLRTLDKVLSKLADSGLRLKKAKCVFMVPSVDHLGHHIDREGLHPTGAKGRQQVLVELHKSHPGINKMKGFAQGYVWWPNMDKETVEWSLNKQHTEKHDHDARGISERNFVGGRIVSFTRPLSYTVKIESGVVRRHIDHLRARHNAQVDSSEDVYMDSPNDVTSGPSCTTAVSPKFS
ncbi:hypothetical protein EMCRGX_G017361 [Ephydatia muelleri]